MILNSYKLRKYWATEVKKVICSSELELYLFLKYKEKFQIFIFYSDFFNLCIQNSKNLNTYTLNLVYLHKNKN